MPRGSRLDHLERGTAAQPDDGAVVHSLGKGGRHLVGARVVRAHAIDEGPGVFPGVAVDDQPVLAHIDVAWDPVRFVGQPDRQRGTRSTLSLHRGIRAWRAGVGRCLQFQHRFDATGKQIDDRDLRLALSRGGPHAEPNQELLADGDPRDRVALRVEELADNLDALALLRGWRIAIEARLGERDVRWRGAAAGELYLRGSRGQIRLADRAVGEYQRAFAPIFADLTGAKRGRGGGALREGVERQQRVRGRQRVHAVGAD